MTTTEAQEQERAAWRMLQQAKVRRDKSKTGTLKWIKALDAWEQAHEQKLQTELKGEQQK